MVEIIGAVEVAVVEIDEPEDPELDTAASPLATTESCAGSVVAGSESEVEVALSELVDVASDEIESAELSVVVEII